MATDKFNRIKLIIATVQEISVNTKAKVPSYALNLNVGRHLLQKHTKPFYKSSAQIVSNYTPESLLNTQLLIVANFPTKQIGKSTSHCLTTAVIDTNAPEETKRDTYFVVHPTGNVENGSLVSITGDSSIYETNERDLSWEEFTQVEIRVVGIHGVNDILEIDGKYVYNLQVESGNGLKSAKLVTCSVIEPTGNVLALVDGDIYHILTVGGSSLLQVEQNVIGHRLA
ncbi:hypothetical protein HK103_003472 [Boothiomyces macroporosus]|uniref:Uncharacterized protein n=1 Tax=Boothiomyces macroporosus TaxID=261099 RepID=A0AAD5UCI1_9FUNG|nr:hypothetical protein HK103_003472 [Boothiomyces macroporosus]